MLACKGLQHFEMFHVNDVNLVSICDCSLVWVHALHTQSMDATKLQFPFVYDTTYMSK